MSRAALLLEALEVVEKATFADEALFAEAAKYVDSPSFFVGGRDLSSFTPSGFGLAMAKRGSFGGLASVGGEEQTLLSIILVDGRSWEKSLVEVRVEGKDEELPQELEGKGCRWDDNCLARFNKFLGFSMEGFEGEILNLLLRTKRRREQSNKRGTIGTTKFDRELKKLHWSIEQFGWRRWGQSLDP